MTPTTPDPAATRAAGRTPSADDQNATAPEFRRQFSRQAIDRFEILYRVALDEPDPGEAVRRFANRRRLEAEVDDLARIHEDYAILDARDAGMELAKLAELFRVKETTIEKRLARARARRRFLAEQLGLPTTRRA